MAWTTPKTWTELETLTSSDMNLQVKGNIEYLKGRPVGRVSDLDGTVGNTTSTTFTDVPGASVSITTAGSSRLLVIANLMGNGPGTANTVYITVDIDGVNQGDATYGVVGNSQANTYCIPVSFLTTASLSNASHTVKLRYRVTGGTATIYTFSMSVLEVY